MSLIQATARSIPFKHKVLNFLRLIISTIARFLFVLYYGKTGKQIPPITDDILKDPAIEVARKIRNKEITSVEVVEACIRRIKDVNSALNCFVEDRFELALKEAKEADELIRSSTEDLQKLEAEKPFLGVPFTTKDCIAVQGLHQTCGLVSHKDAVATEDAPVVRLLKEKGAIILGLTNTPELCLWWETHNHVHGRSTNPYNTTRTVGGSSGGEGGIQAAGGSIFGIGSDIGGSIRMPAFFNGIFGHKPSQLIVSNEGQFPKATSAVENSLLCIGPMVRHAVDLKPLLKIISGENSTKLNLDKTVDIKKLKVYYQFSNEAPFTDSVDPDIITAMKKVVDFLNKQHKIDAEEEQIPLLQRSSPIWLTTMTQDHEMGDLLMENNTVGNIILEISKNVVGLSGNTLIVLLFTAIFDRFGVKYGSEEYKHNLKLRDELEKYFKDLLGDDGVFLYPTHPTPAPYHNETLLKPMNFCYTAIINSLGLPSTAVPLGLGKEGLPIGIQVVANHNNDRLCLAVAEELDKAFGGWIEPKLTE